MKIGLGSFGAKELVVEKLTRREGRRAVVQRPTLAAPP